MIPRKEYIISLYTSAEELKEIQDTKALWAGIGFLTALCIFSLYLFLGGK